MPGTNRYGLLLVVVLLLGGGCTDQPAGETEAASEAGAPAHNHGSGPHGGTVADWGGGKYHVEFTVDHDGQQATVYVLADDAATPAPIAAETLLLSINEPVFQVELVAAGQEGEQKVAASRFAGKHEGLGVVQEFAGTISGEIDGTPYAGDFSEHGHEHE